MRRIAFLLFAAITMACFVFSFSPASGHAAGEAAPIYVTQIPPGYRDWKVISVAHEEGNLNSLGAILGNDTAIKASRDGKLPLPDGTIIAACTTAMSRRRKTTKFSAAPNRSFQGRPQTYSLWSRTQQSTPQRADGDSVTSTQATANLAMRRS
jgi:Cytochrome P460